MTEARQMFSYVTNTITFYYHSKCYFAIVICSSLHSVTLLVLSCHIRCHM